MMATTDTGSVTKAVLRKLSVAAFVAMVLGIVVLFQAGAAFARHVPMIAIQVAAVLLMIAARVTFGRRSFHAAANPTAGGLVMTGPYAYIRHPIYSAAIYFCWAGALDNLSLAAVAGAAIVTAGAIVRMFSEERLLVAQYPAYREYMTRVRRVVPFVV
jgi:protein-S-isoprenylcysteine O-methyltransferase Ste14